MNKQEAYHLMGGIFFITLLFGMPSLLPRMVLSQKILNQWYQMDLYNDHYQPDEFREDFSTDPDTNGLWQIFRQTGYSGIWDSDSEVFYLTRDIRWQSSIMFANYTMTSHSWTTSFRFKAGGQSNGVCGDQGGDGITFFFYANTFTPGSGRIPPPAQGYSIKLDSYTGRTCDVIPGELIDYIAIMKGDTILTTVQDNRVEDNQWHTLNITFDNGAIVVIVDNSPVINYQIQNPDYTFSSMGFNAITGNASNDQIIDDFVFSPTTTPSCVSPNTNLNVCQLQKGDILLVKGNFNFGRQFVRMVAGTYWYHVAIYVDDGYVAQATGPDPIPVADQVKADKIYDTPWWTGNGLNDWIVIRPRTTDIIKAQAADFAKAKADPPDIPYNNNFFDKDNENAFYCSQLPWKAYKRQNQGPDLEVNKGILTNLFGPIITPDDLYYSVTEGRADVVQEDPSVSNNFERWVFGIFSPANMLLVDPLGRRAGYDSVTQQIINEIPNADYIGPDGEVEALSVAIPSTDKEGWKLIVTGTGNGTYSLATEVLDVHNPVDQALTFETSPGHVDVFQIVNPSTHPGELIRQISQVFLPLVQR